MNVPIETPSDLPECLKILLRYNYIMPVLDEYNLLERTSLSLLQTDRIGKNKMREDLKYNIMSLFNFQYPASRISFECVTKEIHNTNKVLRRMEKNENSNIQTLEGITFPDLITLPGFAHPVFLSGSTLAVPDKIYHNKNLLKLKHGLMIEWDGMKVKHCSMQPICDWGTTLFGIMVGPKAKFAGKLHSDKTLNVAQFNYVLPHSNILYHRT